MVVTVEIVKYGGYNNAADREIERVFVAIVVAEADLAALRPGARRVEPDREGVRGASGDGCRQPFHQAEPGRQAKSRGCQRCVAIVAHGEGVLNRCSTFRGAAEVGRIAGARGGV